MEKAILGATGIEVSRLCFGSLTVCALQSNLPLLEGAQVIARGLSHGVSFIDTAQYYRNYQYIRNAIAISGRYDTVIASKSYAYNKELAVRALEQARRELDRDVIDIFLLHEQEDELTIRGHREALEYYYNMKARGVIRAVGLSTHKVAAVRGAIALRNILPIEVIHPIFNLAGTGIGDGTVEDMRSALLEARSLGIGIYTMKPLGGGRLYRRADECFDFVLNSGVADSVAVGMGTLAEVDANIEYFERRSFSAASKSALAAASRSLLIEDYCLGCGACAERCGQHAISIIDGHAVCDHDKCVLCGYCSPVCPEFAIKIIPISEKSAERL